MSQYSQGNEILGAQAMQVQFKDPAAVIKDKGGASGALAYWAAPQTVENAAYDKMVTETLAKMAAEGIPADVRVVEAQAGNRSPTEFLNGVAVGAGGVGAGWLLWKFVVKGLFSGRRK